MNEELQKPVFCGVITQGTQSAIAQFVIGKFNYPIPLRKGEPADFGSGADRNASEWLRSAMGMKMMIDLIEPVLVHRVFVMGKNPDGSQALIVTHQFIEDPYWPNTRGAEVPFNLGHFLTARFFDGTIPQEQEEIARYENALVSRFAAKSGLVLPGPGRNTSTR